MTLIYSCASIYNVSLSNIWCNDGNLISWDEVVSHNAGLLNSVGEGGCWRSSTVRFTDDVKLFATINGGFEKATIAIEIFNVIKMILYGIVFILLCYLFIKYTYRTFVDCKKTINHDW